MRDFDHTKVKPGDRFRTIDMIQGISGAGEIITASNRISDKGFFSEETGWFYAWSQVEPIRPQLITRPIEGMPEWLASTPKGEAVKCRVWDDGKWLSDPAWIIGAACGYVFVDEEGTWFEDAEPWTEPEPEPKHSLFTPEQLAELDARYRRKDA